MALAVYTFFLLGIVLIIFFKPKLRFFKNRTEELKTYREMTLPRRVLLYLFTFFCLFIGLGLPKMSHITYSNTKERVIFSVLSTIGLILVFEFILRKKDNF